MTSFTELGSAIHDYPDTGLPGELAEIVIGLEDTHHEQGWDEQPASLCVLDQVEDNDHALSSRADPGLGYEFKRTRIGMVTHPRQEIIALAHHAGTAAAHPGSVEHEIVSTMYPRIPFAHVLTVEAWGRTDTAADSPANADGSRRDGRSLADIPGSVELRTSLLVHNTHTVFLVRQRGAAPRIMIDGDAQQWGGELFTAVRRLHNNARALHTQKIRDLFGTRQPHNREV